MPQRPIFFPQRLVFFHQTLIFLLQKSERCCTHFPS
jgi:hypothetical protein